MSVWLLRRSFHLRTRRAPVLRFSVHRLSSLRGTVSPTEPLVTAAEESNRSHDYVDTEDAPYAPPRLYSTPTVKVASKRHRKQKIELQDTASKQFDPAEFSARNILRPKNLITKREFESVESHLAALNATGKTPSLADLERFRSTRLFDTDSSGYAQEFSNLMDKLCRSFSKDQLMTFMQIYDPFGRKSRPNRRKTDYAGSIIEHWGWISMEEVERAKRDRTEVSVQFFPVTRAELFLILGRDGADLLTLSQEFNAHIALAPEPLALRVEGVRNSITGIQERIALLKQNMISKTVYLPIKTNIRTDLIQQISRAVGAYLEYSGSGGEVVITAIDDDGLRSAERLVIRAAHELYISSIIPQLCYITNPHMDDSALDTLFPSRYALYPHHPGRSRPPALHSARTFRLRKVIDVLTSASEISSQSSDGLSSEHGAVFTRAGSMVNLRSLLFDDIPWSQRERTVKASLGHIVINDAGDTKADLIPSFSGYHSFRKVQEWLTKTQVRTAFLPHLPFSLIRSLPLQQHVLHRLTYEALPIDQPVGRITNAAVQGFAIPTVHNLTFEVLLAEPKSTTHSSTSTDPNEDELREQVPLSEASLVHALQRKVDVMLPDRFMDARFTVADSRPVSREQWPHLLQEYARALVTFVNNNSNTLQPDPPLMLEHEGLEYILHGTSSVRQSTEPTSVPEMGTGTAAQVVSESILDLENDQKTAQCVITCGSDSPNDWLHFLAVCDALSGTPFINSNAPRLDSTVSVATNISD